MGGRCKASEPEAGWTDQWLNFQKGIRGHHTIRPKSHAKGPFRWPLPLESVLKEGFERKIPRICRSRAIHAQTTVFESR